MQQTSVSLSDFDDCDRPVSPKENTHQVNEATQIKAFIWGVGEELVCLKDEAKEQIQNGVLHAFEFLKNKAAVLRDETIAAITELDEEVAETTKEASSPKPQVT